MMYPAVIHAYVAECVAVYMNAVKARGGKPQAVTLVRYPDEQGLWEADPDWQGNTLAEHEEMLERVRDALTFQGASVHIVTMDKAAYFKWLAQNGKVDSSESRAAWGATQVGKM